MRTFAITGIDTASIISRMIRGAAMRATPPSLRMSAGTRSRAITAQAPASSAILACCAVVTSMMTPPFSISAKPTFTRQRLLFTELSIEFPFLLVVASMACSPCLSLRYLRLCVSAAIQKKYHSGPRTDLDEAPASARQHVALCAANLSHMKQVSSIFLDLTRFHHNLLLD